jgi:hypothetical protein
MFYRGPIPLPSHMMRLLPICFFAALGLIFQVDVYPAQERSEYKKLAEQGIALLKQANYPEAEEVFRRWAAMNGSDANAHYYLAVSQALQGKTEPALDGFRKALGLAPKMADAYFEIAGIYFKKKQYPEAFSYAKKGLRFAPRSEYGLDLAGTIAFLLGSKIEALGFWNKLDRPHLTELRISSGASLDRQRIAEEIDLKPGSLLSRSEIIKAQWRLQQHDYIRAASFTLVPGSEENKYSLEAYVDSRKGFGTPVELIANTLANVGFQTFRLTYWNPGNSGLTLSLRTRLKSSARWAEFRLRAPRPAHLGFYGETSYGWRDESWDLAPDSGGATGLHRLRTHEFSAAALVPIHVPQFSIKGELVVRRRREESPASPDVSQPLSPVSKANWLYVSWIRLSPSLGLIDRRVVTGYGWNSRLRADIDIGRTRKVGMQNLSRMSLSWENRLDRVSAGGLQSTVRLGLHGGRLSRATPLEDYFRLGVGPDVKFQLRAHPLFRNGKLGSTPLAGEFVLGNLTVGQDLFDKKLLRLGIAGFCDAARMPRIYPRQSLSGTALDAGVGIEIGLLGRNGPNFTLTYGRNVREHRNAFYLATMFR